MRVNSCLSVALTLLFGLGCDDGKDDGDGESDGEATETGGEVEDQHGSIGIEAYSLTGDELFDGTTEVVATVLYDACLQTFYLDRRPTYQQAGADGGPIFADWATRLCSEFDDVPACQVTSIEQTLSPDGDTYTLSVTFEILDASTILDHEFPIGPLPLEPFAACDAGALPEVELRQTGLLGYDAQGVLRWRIATLPANNTAVADQGAPLRVEVIAVTP